jgi:PAS domain S-box-containing protein
MSAAPLPDVPREWVLSLLSSLGDAVLELGPEGDYRSVIAASTTLPFTTTGLRGRNVRDHLPPELLAPALRALREVNEDGVPRTIDFALDAGGEHRQCEARVAPGSDGSLLLLVRDVHDQRVAQRKLRESEGRFRLMADHAPVMLWKSDTSSECDFFNQRWLEFTGRSMEAELGVGWASGIHPADFAAAMDCYMQAFVERRPFRMEYRLRRADGAYRWILDQGAPRTGDGGTFEGFVGSCVDVTDMKESEAQARALADEVGTRLAEREVLLREVHHRVKNNLQLISSMHNLQARLASGEARAQLRDAQRRVLSIALVHERLCEPDTLSELDFLGYLREAARSVLQLGYESAGIELAVDGDSVPMSIDKAVPCGLLVSELVVNAFKHAFPGERRGRVRVELKRLATGRVVISVSDDGIGLPATVDLKSPATTGLDLVVALTRQLNATLAHRSVPGARFDIELSLDGEVDG